MDPADGLNKRWLRKLVWGAAFFLGGGFSIGVSFGAGYVESLVSGYLPPSQTISWWYNYLWRIPILLGFIMIFIGFFEIADAYNDLYPPRPGAGEVQVNQSESAN